MNKLLISLIVLSSAVAHAGVDLLIEHPRNPSQQRDSYKIHCEKKCAFEIIAMNPVKGEGDHKLEAKVKEFWSLNLPQEISINPSRVFYTIEAMDGDKKLHLSIGYPGSYQGEELVKYLSVISFIEDVKRSIRSESGEGNK